jgi:hypothetical protein
MSFMVLKWTLVLAPTLLLVVACVLAIAIAFGTAAPPAPMASISSRFARLDYSALPEPRQLAARDGTPLSYRRYDGDPRRVVLLANDRAASMRIALLPGVSHIGLITQPEAIAAIVATLAETTP